jgi:hypothetical protein
LNGFQSRYDIVSQKANCQPSLAMTPWTI